MITLRVSADPWALKLTFGLVSCHLSMKSVKLLSSVLTLYQPNLSHMDSLDAPAVIHGSRLIISNTTQDERSNELINPEILMNNHHKRTYSFTLILPAIFPDTLYLLVPV